MKRVVKKNAAAFNRIELLVVIVAVFVVAALAVVPTGSYNAKWKSERIRCVNNLKQVGTALRIWVNDNPGGDKNLRASNCWSFFATVLNNGKVSAAACPADERKPAKDGTTLPDNLHVSYFAGVDALDTEPQAILAGDRNLGPGTIPDPEYGYSPASGTGNDVLITNEVCWSLKMHSHKNIVSAGNILLGDGSSQQCTSMGLRETWIRSAALATTNSRPLHLLFP